MKRLWLYLKRGMVYGALAGAIIAFIPAINIGDEVAASTFAGAVMGLIFGGPIGFIVWIVSSISRLANKQATPDGRQSAHSKSSLNSTPFTAQSASRDAQDYPPPPVTFEIELPSASPRPQTFNRGLDILKRRPKVRWVPAGEDVAVASRTIKAGMIYVGDGDPGEDAAELIRTDLRVGRSGRAEKGSLSYWPKYHEITPDQRADYLDWLAAGRKDPDYSVRDHGHIFLFFYGLERRLFVDQADDAKDVVQEVARLVRKYGAFGGSLRSYGTQLMHFWGWSLGPQGYGGLWPQLLGWQNCRLGEQEMAMMLANLVLAQRPLPASLAYHVAKQDPRSRSSVVLKRAPEEFKALFETKYKERCGEGMALKAAKRQTTVGYRPASPTLTMAMHFRGRGEMSHSIPNVMGISSQFGPIVQIWDKCIEELSAFSRARSKESGQNLSLNAYLALPAQLRENSAHPLQEKWDALMDKVEPDNGFALVPVRQVARIMDFGEGIKLTAKQSRTLADVVESLGYAVEPDARSGGTTYECEKKVGVFKAEESGGKPPSGEYQAASAMFHLSMMIASADGNVSDEESHAICSFIDSLFHLDDDEATRMGVLERLLSEDPDACAKVAKRIAQTVPSESRGSIGRLLVTVAAADGKVTPDEVRAMKKVFALLELPVHFLDNLLSEFGPQDEVTIQEGGPSTKGEPIPARPGKTKKDTGFSIDMNRVAMTMQETQDLIKILGTVMAEGEADSAPATAEQQAASSAPASVAKVSSEEREASSAEETKDAAPEWAEGLSPLYVPIVRRLIGRGSWTKADFAALAAEHNVMPLKMNDAINEWSDEHLGDMLLEGDDPVQIHADLINLEGE